MSKTQQQPLRLVPMFNRFVPTLYQRALDCEPNTTTYTITGDFLNTSKVGLAREPASFWRENMIAVVIPLRVLAGMSW